MVNLPILLENNWFNFLMESRILTFSKGRAQFIWNKPIDMIEAGKYIFKISSHNKSYYIYSVSQNMVQVEMRCFN